MARIFITGSTDGLGRAAAGTLMDEGHEVLLHARTAERAKVLAELAPRTAGIVIGELSSATEVRRLAESVNATGRMDAIIHNAGVYLEPARGATPEGHARTLAVNTLAPYLLTGLISRPDRLIYLSSGMHRSGTGPLQDIDWTQRRWNPVRAYAESKLHVNPGPGGRPPLANGTKPRRGSGLGPNQDGRPRRTGRPGDGTPHPNVVGHER